MIAVEVGSGVSLRLGIFEATADAAFSGCGSGLQLPEPASSPVETVLLRGAFQLSDVIQILESCQKIGALTVTAGSDIGIIYLNNGRIVNAVYRNESGEAAFFALFGRFALKPASFEFLPSASPFPELLASSNTYLLLEGLRLLDEAARGDVERQTPKGEAAPVEQS